LFQVIDKPWACTLNSVDWLREGFTAGKLDYLGMQFGWFYDRHRALADCEACMALLAQRLPKSQRRVISVVREAPKVDPARVKALKEAGKSIKEIMAATDLSRASVYRALAA